MTCSAPTKCEFICTGGNCKSVICKADTCEEVCTDGGCGLQCYGNSCDQVCVTGNCKLQCPNPNDPEKCRQSCTLNKDKCIINKVNSTDQTPTTKVPDECNKVEDGVCYQPCPGGGCTLECFNNTKYYHSCKQICTGNVTQTI